MIGQHRAPARVTMLQIMHDPDLRGWYLCGQLANDEVRFETQQGLVQYTLPHQGNCFHSTLALFFIGAYRQRPTTYSAQALLAQVRKAGRAFTSGGADPRAAFQALKEIEDRLHEINHPPTSPTISASPLSSTAPSPPSSLLKRFLTPSARPACKPAPADLFDQIPLRPLQQQAAGWLNGFNEILPLIRRYQSSGYHYSPRLSAPNPLSDLRALRDAGFSLPAVLGKEGSLLPV